ncbi:uncharacterized protein LOC135834904 [Planococcus citri]|uniref:uncharacterized protein LOC135834904 n=1 Tax=Planococcus citri TaxID=170843 RepID=UPI0031F9E33A
MNFKMKTSLLIFFIAKYVVLMKASDSPRNYDITKALNESINGILQMSGWDQVGKAFEGSFGHTWSYETKNVRKIKIGLFGDKIKFEKLEFLYHPEAYFLSIHWTSSGNTTRIQCGNAEFFLDGLIFLQPNATYADGYIFKSTSIQNFSITVTELSTDRNNKTKTLDIDYQDVIDWEHTKLRGFDHVPNQTREKILLEIDLMVSKLVRYCLTHNKKFRNALKHSSFIYPKQNLIRVHPDFSRNEHKYYYLIPKICLNEYHLESVAIQGLSNFESFNGTSLHVKDIHGFMAFYLHEMPIVYTIFEIDHLFVSFDRENRSITVDAQKYKIRQFDFGDSPSKYKALISYWLDEFSSVLMRHIESAIAKSIMPSMKEANWEKNEPCLKTCAERMENSLGRIQQFVKYERDHSD